MAQKNDELLKRLLATFRLEADEHIKLMSAELLELEKTSSAERRAEIIETVFREAHSLKGAARAVNLTQIESVCQALESVFAGLKSGSSAVSPQLLDLLYQAIAAVGGLLGQGAGSPGVSQQAVAALIRQLESASKGRLPRRPAAADDKKPVSGQQAEPFVADAAGVPLPAPGLGTGTVRVATAKLDDVMRQTEELLVPRLSAAQRARELREVVTTLAVWNREQAWVQDLVRSMERAAERGSADAPRAGIPKLLEHVNAARVFMRTLEDRLARLARFAGQDQRALATMAENLLQDVKEMHMLPFSSLLDVFPRLARELSRDQGKEVELVVRGAEIEIDRRILEEVKDPLIHLLRNCIDHGIETPAVRGRNAKPPHATITIAISQKDSGKVEVTIADDGAGIDLAKLKEAACRLGIVSAEQAEVLADEEALALVFRSGLSTSAIVTDLSGRGLGLAIVREKIERLGGVVTVESRPGSGTGFRLVLPLELATFRGILVRAGGQLFVLPAASVERVIRVVAEDIRTVENRETIAFDGRAVSLVRLGEVLEMPPGNSPGEAAARMPVMVLGRDSARVAFLVEEILGEQEVLVKALGPQLVRVRNVAGASVLGTGQVVPVLNVPDLMKSAVKRGSAQTAHTAGKPAQSQERAILVVEDSITSRTLLKSILESAGYRVSTATDGMDAYSQLKTGTFDLVVSDVEMPRMDGFGLTAKVRADKQLADLPVVLVTALGSREHRERGIDVGANAYIVKSSFEQSNLLEVVRRLI